MPSRSGSRAPRTGAALSEELLQELITGALREIWAHEDFSQLRAWIAGVLAVSTSANALPDNAGSERTAGSELTPPASSSPLATALAATLWNATPLPGAGYRCRPVDFPALDLALTQEEIWAGLAEVAPVEALERALAAGAVPAAVCAPVVMRVAEAGPAERSLALLEAWFEQSEERLAALDTESEPALELLVELYAERGEVERLELLLERSSALLRPPLCAALWRRRALLALERGQHELAADCLERAALAAPRHPALGPLEVLLLLETGAPERAAELAREWCRRLEEQGIALGDDYAFLREVARGPAVSSRARAADLADDLSVR